MPLRRSPLPLLLATVLMASIVLFGPSQPAAADHGETNYWSATLTVEDMGGARYGCDNSRTGNECSAALTDGDFTYDGENYEIVSVHLRRGTLNITLNKYIPTEFNALTLRAGTANLALADNNAAALESAQWSSTGLDWSEGDTVELSLSELTPTGVTLSTDTLAITEGTAGFGTFTVALSADPGADTTVKLVRTQFFQSDVGQSGHVWDLNAATVSPDALTFTTGSSGDWDTAQTVTVTAPEDDDSCPEQMVILIVVEATAGSGNANPDYEPVGGSANSVTGVYVTISDNDGGACGGI